MVVCANPVAQWEDEGGLGSSRLKMEPEGAGGATKGAAAAGLVKEGVLVMDGNPGRHEVPRAMSSAKWGQMGTTVAQRFGHHSLWPPFAVINR